ncbi:MAG: hypothetical protein CMO55_21320 [Verrucomicrobiales bacterium]|nr:hypothetical protein [Verrucomicrobiales bacterium]
MRRVSQSVEDLLENLIPVETTWVDDHALAVIEMLKNLPHKEEYTREDVRGLLAFDFPTGTTVIRLFLDLSKDEYTIRLKSLLVPGQGIGIKRFSADPETYLESLEKLGILDGMSSYVNRKTHWSDVLVERLKGGRGSAIKGQQRGRTLEDTVEKVVAEVFGNKNYDSRCRFVGASKLSTEKADFAIPSASDAHILIEVKAYGATGSKQTDVLGDISRIVEEKRDDTIFFLFTDGVSWKERVNDLRKLIALQNRGSIQKIYTTAMMAEFRSDLDSLKKSLGLGE